MFNRLKYYNLLTELEHLPLVYCKMKLLVHSFFTRLTKQNERTPTG